MRKSCQVYARRGDLFVAALARTDTALWITSPPVTKVADDTPAAELGALVLSTLDQTAYDVPAPNFRTDPLPITPVLELAGVKSWSTFVKGTRFVEVNLDDGEFSLVPMVNTGGRQGFDWPDDSHVVRMAAPGADTAGRALRDLLAAMP